MMIPENAPVRLLSAQLEELEYGKLYEAYSSKGRKSAAEPRVLFKVLIHGYLCGIYSSRKLVFCIIDIYINLLLPTIIRWQEEQ